MEDISVAANIYLITNYTDYPRSIIVQEDKTFFFFYLPADIFQAIYPDNTLRKLFFNIAEVCQPQAEESHRSWLYFQS